MIDYDKRLVEVDEILNYLSKEELLKIPEEIRQLIKSNKDKGYVWKYDETKELKDQELSRDTIAFLSYLNMEYLLNKEQKQLMQQIHQFNEKKLEEKKKKQYNSHYLFKAKQNVIEDTLYIPQNELIVYKENIFSKILNKIKNFLINNFQALIDNRKNNNDDFS